MNSLQSLTVNNSRPCVKFHPGGDWVMRGNFELCFRRVLSLFQPAVFCKCMSKDADNLWACSHFGPDVDQALKKSRGMSLVTNRSTPFCAVYPCARISSVRILSLNCYWCEPHWLASHISCHVITATYFHTQLECQMKRELLPGLQKKMRYSSPLLSASTWQASQN